MTLKLDILSEKGWPKIYIVKNDLQLQDQKLHQLLHPQELKKLSSFSHSNKIIDFQRSRIILHKLYDHQKKHAFINAKNGSLIWPKGYTGSLSHKDQNIIILGGRISKFVFGIDLEKAEISSEIIYRVLSEKEKKIHENLARKVGRKYASSILFSLKESCFKCFNQSLGSEKEYLNHYEISELNLKRNNALVSHTDSLNKVKIKTLVRYLKLEKKVYVLTAVCRRSII